MHPTHVYPDTAINKACGIGQVVERRATATPQQHYRAGMCAQERARQAQIRTSTSTRRARAHINRWYSPGAADEVDIVRSLVEQREGSHRKCVEDLPGAGFQKLRGDAQREEPAKRQREAARRQLRMITLRWARSSLVASAKCFAVKCSQMFAIHRSLQQRLVLAKSTIVLCSGDPRHQC